MATLETSDHRSAPAERVCVVCKKADVTAVCQRCAGAWYCSKDCQLKDWDIHKILCKAYAASRRPEPGSSGEEYSRIIVFDPRKRRPDVVWVDRNKEWVLDILYPGENSPAKRYAITISNRPVVARFAPITPADVTYDHHIQCIQSFSIRDAHGRPLRARPHEGIHCTLRAAKLPRHRSFRSLPMVMTRWDGKDKWGEVLIPGGPKLRDMTMADWSCSVQWLSNLRVSITRKTAPSTWEGFRIAQITLHRLSRSAWRSCIVKCGFKTVRALRSEERWKSALRSAKAAQRPERPFDPRKCPDDLR